MLVPGTMFAFNTCVWKELLANENLMADAISRAYRGRIYCVNVFAYFNHIYSTTLSSNTWILPNYHKFHKRMDVVAIFFLRIMNKRDVSMRSIPRGKYTNTSIHALLLSLSSISTSATLSLRLAFHLCLRMGLNLLFSLKNAERNERNQQQNCREMKFSLPLSTTYDFKYTIYVKWLEATLQAEQKHAHIFIIIADLVSDRRRV